MNLYGVFVSAYIERLKIADGGYAIGMEKVGLITVAQDIKTFHSELINDDNGIVWETLGNQ